MKIYKHRVNKMRDLERLSPEFGAEIDLRLYFGELILQHDPFKAGELFSEWLKVWNGHSLILNVKECGIEEMVLQLLAEKGISDFFFLDQSYPIIRQMISNGNSKVATRVSDFEDIETASKSGSDWVWLDSFSGNWSYLKDIAPMLRKNSQQTCLVSPELQRLEIDAEVIMLKNILLDNEIQVSAVCTKNVELWQP